jgi:hypothetical protein
VNEGLELQTITPDWDGTFAPQWDTLYDIGKAVERGYKLFCKKRGLNAKNEFREMLSMNTRAGQQRKQLGIEE